MNLELALLDERLDAQEHEADGEALCDWFGVGRGEAKVSGRGVGHASTARGRKKTPTAPINDENSPAA